MHNKSFFCVFQIRKKVVVAIKVVGVAQYFAKPVYPFLIFSGVLKYEIIMFLIYYLMKIMNIKIFFGPNNTFLCC